MDLLFEPGSLSSVALQGGNSCGKKHNELLSDCIRKVDINDEGINLQEEDQV